MTVRYRYQEQDSEQTLTQALEEYYRAHPGILDPTLRPSESAALLRAHDLCHVIFGLDTTFEDEALADFRTVLGTDVGVKRYLRYLRSSKEVQTIFSEAGYGPMILATIRAMPRFVRALLEIRRLKRRWPWNPPEGLLDESVAKLRQDFGIRVL